MTLKSSSYLLPTFSRLLIREIGTMVNGTLLNFGKRYNNFRDIFDQWLKLHLGLDALSNPKKKS